MPGPIFANLVLADEINRCPPKTQAALLEAMQERRVTVRGRAYELPDPFVVLATQNPIEQEGTYPLPEAQLDRFFFQVRLGYPARDEEVEVLRRTTTDQRPDLRRILAAREVVQLQDLVRRVPAPDPVLAYAADLARATRPADGHPEARRWLAWGAGPRGAQVLVLAAKARALLSGRFHASCDDVVAIALPALRHRVVPSFAAAAEGLTADAVLLRIVPDVPRGG
jgi:MoxR-like ATPase